MNGTISGYLIDAVTGEITSSSELSLNRDGVLGESLTRADGRGRFAFTSLPSGKYSLGVHDNRYAPLYRNLILEEGETIEPVITSPKRESASGVSYVIRSSISVPQPELPRPLIATRILNAPATRPAKGPN
jgi:hypothetical protein